MKTIWDINELLKKYPMYYSYKPNWYHSQFKDIAIKRVEYNKNTMLIIWNENKEIYMTWELQNCINKIYNEILRKKSIWLHCLYADPL